MLVPGRVLILAPSTFVVLPKNLLRACDQFIVCDKQATILIILKDCGSLIL